MTAAHQILLGNDRKLPALIALAALLAAASATSVRTAMARDIFVDNMAGDERNDGRSERSVPDYHGPVKSIRRALEWARPGDRIIVAKTEQPYREGFSLVGNKHSGSDSYPTAIIGNGAIVDGSSPVPADAWEFYQGDIFRFHPQRLTFQQLFENDVPLPRRMPETDPPQLPDLQPKEWCLWGDAIYFRPEKDKLPSDYALSYAARTVGITLYKVRNVVITDLVVQGFQLDGVNAHEGTSNCVIDGLTCRGNGRSGVAVVNASRLIVRECLIGDNGRAQVYTEGYSRTRLEDCELVENTAPGIVQNGGRVFVNGEER